MKNLWSDNDTRAYVRRYAKDGISEDVVQAFRDLALAEKTTGAVMTVDGGNIAAALR